MFRSSITQEGRQSKSARPPLEKDTSLRDLIQNSKLVGTITERNHNMKRYNSQTNVFSSLKALEDHVNKMYHNASGCTRKNSCESCLRGQREHNWPEHKVLRLSKIQPLNVSSRLLQSSRYSKSIKGDENANCTALLTNDSSTLKSVTGKYKKHNLIIPSASTAALNTMVQSKARKNSDRTVLLDRINSNKLGHH